MANINKTANAWDWPGGESLAANRQGINRFLVFNTTGDPKKTHRVQIRSPEWPKDEMPDETCPWIQVGGSQTAAGAQTVEATHAIQPGTMLYACRTGEQDYTGIATNPNDNQGMNDSSNPAASGVGEHKSHTSEAYDGKMQPGMDIRQVVGCTTTECAERIRDSSNRQATETEEPVKRSVETDKTPTERKKAREAYESSFV